MSAWIVALQQPLLRLLVEADSPEEAVASARERYAKEAGQPAERFSAVEPLAVDPEAETAYDVPIGEADLLILARRVGRKVAYRIRVRSWERADVEVPYVDVYYVIVLPDDRGRVRRYWHHHGSFGGVDAGGLPLPAGDIEPLYLRHPDLFEAWEPPADEVSPEDVLRARLCAGAIVQAAIVAGEVPTVERDDATTTIGVGAGKTSRAPRGLTFQVGPRAPFVLHAHAEDGHELRTLTAPVPTEAAARDLASAAVAWVRGGEPIDAVAAIWDRVFPPTPS